MEPQIIETLTQFGVAGLMGALWMWERAMSRRRDAELSEAHRKLMAQHEQLRTVLRLIDRNTRAIERFDQTQRQLVHLLEKMSDETRRQAA